MTDVQVQTQIPDRDELMKLVPSKNFRLVKFFENMAKDVSTTLPDAIGQSLQGPTGGVGDRDVVIFDGTSGLAVKDSGVPIDDLAPKESPTFTGTPTAPTPAALDNSARLATTSFVATATANSVQGPAVSVDNDLALFSGVTGKIVKDSGVQISSLAPLASPPFTGNPTAPNQTLGDNDTSIANTAFVQAAIANLSANAASFSAHNNGVVQSIPSGATTVVNLGTTVFNNGGLFASNAWVPPAGRPILLTGAVTIASAVGAVNGISILKNGSAFKLGVQVPASVVTTDVVTVTCIDIPNGTDSYQLAIFQNSGAAQNTGGAASQTWFQGTTIRA